MVGLIFIALPFAYFSAIMSTADSCLMAASGNILTDVLKKHNSPKGLLYSQILTLLIGIIALLLALKMTSVLDLMLHSYSFMISGMFIPVSAVLFSKKPNSTAALTSMVVGGTTTLSLIIIDAHLPFGLDANIFGISAALLLYILISNIVGGRHSTTTETERE